jgi:hypothetical protein
MNDRITSSLPADPSWTTASVTGRFALLSEPWTYEQNTALLRAKTEKVTTLHALLGAVTPGINTHRVSGNVCLAKQIVAKLVEP